MELSVSKSAVYTPSGKAAVSAAEEATEDAASEEAALEAAEDAVEEAPARRRREKPEGNPKGGADETGVLCLLLILPLSCTRPLTGRRRYDREVGLRA